MWTLLAGSYFFYGWWDYRFLGLLWFTTAADYLLGRLIEDAPNNQSKRKLVTSSVVLNLGILGIFKYYDFFAASFGDLLQKFGLHPNLPLLHVMLPIGISFYTFMSMSYTIDVYRGKIRAERSLLHFATFVAFFPHLIAGPILRPEKFLVQLRAGPKFSWASNTEGIGWILLGFVRKVVIADSLAPYVDRAFAQPEAFSASGLLVAVIFYAFQIYGDFSGYSDIAYGLGKILGYDIGRNFACPYLANSFSDFWRRWHISLSTWLRDYLYISLGGNRHGTVKTYRNLFLTMLLGGLWHGANWTFLVWGGLHGLYLVIERALSGFRNRWSKRVIPAFIGSPLRTMLIFGIVALTWIFFRSPDFGTATRIFKGLGSGALFSIAGLKYKYWVMKGLMLVLAIVLLEMSAQRMDYRWLLQRSFVFRVTAFAVALCLIALAGTFSGENFIYFQF